MGEGPMPIRDDLKYGFELKVQIGCLNKALGLMSLDQGGFARLVRDLTVMIGNLGNDEDV